MRHFPAQVGANDESIALHLAEVLGQHLLRRLREESVQFAGPRRPLLKSAKNANLPFSLNQRQRKSDRDLFLGRKLAALRRRLLCGLQRMAMPLAASRHNSGRIPIVLSERIEIDPNRRSRHTTPPLFDMGGLAHCLAGVNP